MLFFFHLFVFSDAAKGAQRANLNGRHLAAPLDDKGYLRYIHARLLFEGSYTLACVHACAALLMAIHLRSNGANVLLNRYGDMIIHTNTHTHHTIHHAQIKIFLKRVKII